MYQRREKHKTYLKTRRDSERAKILALLGGKCVRCGFSDPRALQIDHVNGNGHAERISTPSTLVYYNKLLAQGLDGYQLLCANCNWIKRYEQHEHRAKVDL